MEWRQGSGEDYPCRFPGIQFLDEKSRSLFQCLSVSLVTYIEAMQASEEA